MCVYKFQDVSISKTSLGENLNFSLQVLYNDNQKLKLFNSHTI
jgi:hypothetical protein